jgi:N-acyl-D-amino-acid deacylase
MDEENIKKQQQLSWVSFGSDEGSYTPKAFFCSSIVIPALMAMLRAC